MTSQNDPIAVKSVLDQMHIHIRVGEQLADGPWDLSDMTVETLREKLLKEVPAFFPFPKNEYKGGWAVLDWDHRIPSNLFILRVYLVYSEDKVERLEKHRAQRDTGISERNFYPEFDVPDYGDLPADETYLAVVDPKDFSILNWQFASPWRKEGPQELCEEAIEALEQRPAYIEAKKERGEMSLGSLSFVGWLPPCIAKSEAWALEFWLVMRFDGNSGEVQVFVMDSESLDLTRCYRAEVQAN